MLWTGKGWMGDDKVDWSERAQRLAEMTAEVAGRLSPTSSTEPGEMSRRGERVHALSGPTIIMVGGVFTTEDGTTLDSRQPMVGDPRGQVVYRTLSRSHLWWEVVRSLTDSIVKSKPGSYALVDGPRQVFDLTSDGAIKRVSLADFLAVGSPESIWHFPFEEFRAGTSFDDLYRGSAAVVDILKPTEPAAPCSRTSGLCSGEILPQC